MQRAVAGFLVLFALAAAQQAQAQVTVLVDADNCPGPGSGSAIDPFCEIQDAIDAANPVAGDDVSVRCGVYTENIVMVDGVSVRGSGAHCTTIDGAASGSVVTAINIGSSTVLEGFTIRNGSSVRGGGLFLEQSSLTIRQNRIESNTATDAGGGIHVTTDITLRSPRADPSPVITRNVIRNNVAGNFGGGIELYISYDARINDNLIEGNTAGSAGGGIDVFTSFPEVVNNTIVRNCIQGAGTPCSTGGGGIALTSSAVVQVANNVIAWNEAGSGGGGVDNSGASTISFDSNDSFGNLPANYAGIADPTGSNGNISADPLFVNESSTPGGFQPRSDSPLIDAGSASLAPPVDLRGIPRPIDGNADSTAQHDIGARENEGATRLIFTSPTSLTWDLSSSPTATFNLYRGNLQELRATGVYLQSGAVSGVRDWCDDLDLPPATDADAVPVGETRFYLAVVEDTVEGTLGFDSFPAERPFADANSCPSP